jgi:hypothetical protein
MTHALAILRRPALITLTRRRATKVRRPSRANTAACWGGREGGMSSSLEFSSNEQVCFTCWLTRWKVSSSPLRTADAKSLYLQRKTVQQNGLK